MIIFDAPRPCVGVDSFQHFKRTAHCMSTLVGSAGTEELLAFGRRIGLREEWLQRRGEPTEHFDLFDSKIDRAREAGATEVTGRQLVELAIRPKRAANQRVET